MAESTALLEKRGFSRHAKMRRGLFRMLAWLEERRPTGLVVVRAAGREAGRLVVSKGRLCMAIPAATSPAGGEARAPAPDDRGLLALYALAREARARGGSLMNAVVRAGGEHVLRDALLAETAQGLAAIVEVSLQTEPEFETAPARDSYDARLTFGVVEAFAATLGARFRGADVTRHMLDAVGGAGAAVLLVRSEEPGEQPFPVAQVGFDGLALLEFLAIVRAASDINRPGSAGSTATGVCLTAFRTATESWRSVASEARIVLLRASSHELEKATAWAHLFVSRGSGDR